MKQTINQNLYNVLLNTNKNEQTKRSKKIIIGDLSVKTPKNII